MYKKFHNKILILFILMTGLIPLNPAWLFASTPEKACFKKLLPLEKRLATVGQIGGIWAQFEEIKNLRDKSVIALKLDSKLEKLLFSLRYVCESLNGIPFSDLATYINGFLENRTEQEVRQEFKIHGKSKAEVDLWFKYTYFFNQHKNRKLNPATVQKTIELSHKYFDQYVEFSKRVKQMIPEQSLASAERLIESIDSFLETDLNLAQASFENAQAPYWDIDENYGGS